MEEFLIDKYGGRKLTKPRLKELIHDIKNYKEVVDDTEIDVSFDKVIDEIGKFKNKYDGKLLTPRSIKNYRNKIKMIYNVVPDFFQLMIDNPDNKVVINGAFKLIDKKWSNGAKDYYSAISKVIQSFPNLKSKISDYILGRIHQKIKENMNEHVRKTDDKVDTEPLKITWRQFTDGVNKLTWNKDTPLQDKVLFNLYKIWTLRDDYGRVHLVNEDLDNKTNFYNLKTKMFHLNNYKEKDVYGNRKFEIPDSIQKMIQQLYDEGNKYLYESRNKTPYAGGLTDKICRNLSKKYFNIKFCIGDLRKARTTYAKSLSQQKQREIAEGMLHSFTTATNVYVRKTDIE